MKKEAFIQLLKDAGLKTEELNGMVGFNLGKGVWHWFEPSPVSDAWWFNHSYSQNTGVIRKGFAHKRRVIAALEKKLNVKYNQYSLINFIL